MHPQGWATLLENRARHRGMRDSRIAATRPSRYSPDPECGVWPRVRTSWPRVRLRDANKEAHGLDLKYGRGDSRGTACSLTLTPVARAMAWKIGAVSRPDGNRKLHARPTALGGGGAVYLALALGIVGSCLLVFDAAQDKLPAALGISAGMLCLLGSTMTCSTCLPGGNSSAKSFPPCRW